MSYDDALYEAIREVLDMELSDEVCHEAFNTKAAHLAGQESDETNGGTR